MLTPGLVVGEVETQAYAKQALDAKSIFNSNGRTGQIDRIGETEQAK